MANRLCHMAVVIGAGLMAVACQGSTRPDQNRAELERLHATRTCSATLPWFGWVYGGWREAHYVAPDGRISMGNDGGWCWIGTEQYWGPQVITPELRVIEPPAHGSVIAGSVNGELRIAYQPAPSYAGDDRFLVRLGGPSPGDIPVQVTVVR